MDLRKMINQQVSPKRIEEELEPFTTDEISTFMQETHYAIETLLAVVKKIKKDHYSSENDELDEQLETIEESLNGMEVY